MQLIGADLASSDALRVGLEVARNQIESFNCQGTFEQHHLQATSRFKRPRRVAQESIIAEEMQTGDHGMARMQELLSSYYGMQDKESEAESQRDIDAPGFQAPVYVKEMLSTMALPELLARDDKLIREIKELDTNMQMLVYENYNKFISATDSIRKMRSNVATMEREVEKVVESMDVITDKSESINVALAPHRTKIEKLIGVRRLLKRLEFIFELPQRLGSAVKQEDFASATKYFLLARRILGRYDHITSFKAIQVEAEKIVQNLELQLRRRLLIQELASSQVCEAIGLLAQLDACSEENKQQFLDWHQTYFEKKLAKYDSALNNDDSVIYSIKRLNDDVLGELSNVFRVYTDHFMPEITNVKTRKASTAFQDDPFATFAKETFSLYLQACEVQFRRPHTDFGSLSEVESLIGEAALDDADFPSDSNGPEEYFVLMWVFKHFVAQIKQLDAIVPPCHLVKGAIDIIENCVRYQIDLVFKKLRHETLELLQNAHRQVSETSRHNTRTQSIGVNAGVQTAAYQAPSVVLMAQDMASTFADMMKQVLRQMEPLVQTGASILNEMSRLFSDLVQSQFYHFLKWFNSTMLTYTEPKRAFQLSRGNAAEETEDFILPWLEPTPQFLMYVGCVCRELASDGISECLQVLIECLPPPESPNKHEQEDIKKNNVEVAHMIQVTRETSDEIVLHVAKLYGQQLTNSLRLGLFSTSSWASATEEPRAIQDFAVSVIESTFRFAKEISIALGDEQSAFYPGGSGSNSRTTSRDFRRRTSGLLKSRGPGTASGGDSGSGMQLDIERIFAKRIQIFSSPPQLTTDWFVSSMLKMLVKAYGEWIRSFELSAFALQQVQLNAEFLRSTAASLLPAASGDTHQELESLLSDVLSNARERALQDFLMESSNVVAIVSSKSTQVLSRKY